jgi:cytoplasmic iron level regulating protein YaaA (DUF328/UPF0246 family)
MNGMLIITSPAKTLDYESTYSDSVRTLPSFLDESARLAGHLKQASKHQLQELMGISEELAELNEKRFQKWEKEHRGMLSRPAIFAYNGDIYRELHIKQYSPIQFTYMQRSLRIISGLYGVLRPFDMIQPYRLEMSIPLRIGQYKNLYEFWGDKLTRFIRDEAKTEGHTLLVNLASEEYSHAIDLTAIGIPVLTVVFKQRKGSIERTFGIPTKKARGMMIDFLTRRCISDREEMKRCTTSGYRLVDEQPDTLTFITEL